MIADKIRSARTAKGISQEYIAEMLGMSQSAYSKIELKKTKINFEFLQEIAPILGLSTSELILFGDNNFLLSKVQLIEDQLIVLQNIVREQQKIIKNYLQ